MYNVYVKKEPFKPQDNFVCTRFKLFSLVNYISDSFIISFCFFFFADKIISPYLFHLHRHCTT